MHERICDLMGADGDGVLDALSALARTERELTADLVAHLCVTDERRLFVPRGYSSLFRYATAVLGWTEAKAFHRIAVARAARRYPVIVDDLAAGCLSVSGVAVLAPHLSGDDGEALLASARGKSKRQLEAQSVEHVGDRARARSCEQRKARGAAHSVHARARRNRRATPRCDANPRPRRHPARGDRVNVFGALPPADRRARTCRRGSGRWATTGSP